MAISWTTAPTTHSANKIKQVQIGATTYDIHDAVAGAHIDDLKSALEAVQSAVAGGVTFKGVTTTQLTDSSSATSVTIDNKSVTAANGDLVVYGSKEFLFSTADNKWHELGDNTSLGDLAHKDTATVAGTAAAQVFTGTTATITVSGDFAASTVTVSGGSGTATYTPAGTISVTSTGTANYTPAGTVSGNITGTSATISVASTSKFMTGASAAIAKDATNGVQISGTVSAPTISVSTAGSTSSALTTATWSATVTNEVLSFNFAATSATFKTGDASYSATQPTFTGDKFKVNVTPTSATVSATGDYTPAGTFSGNLSGTGVAFKFDGTGTRLTGSVAAQTITSTGSYQPAGTNAASSVTGTAFVS